MALILNDFGLQIETLQEIAQNIGQDQLETVDAGLSQDDDDPLRQLNVCTSRELAETAEAIAVAYGAFDIDAAEGALLDNLGDFKGRPRLTAQNPRVLLSLVLLLGAVVTPGDAVASALDNSRVWLAVGPFVAPANGTYVRTFEAANLASSAVPGEITQIPAITGWVSATNPAPSQPARALETDTIYRARLRSQRDTENGAGTLDSIVDEVSQIPGVQLADARENTTLTPGPTGLPALSFEVLIDDGGTNDASDAVIAQTIWENKPPGGRTFGTTLALAYDTKGRSRLMQFTRINRRRIVVEITIQTLPGWSASQVADVVAAIVQYGSSLKTGQNVIASRVKAAALGVPLTEEVTILSLSIFPTMSGPDASLPMSVDERAVISGGDVTVTIVQLLENIP